MMIFDFYHISFFRQSRVDGRRWCRLPQAALSHHALRLVQMNLCNSNGFARDCRNAATARMLPNPKGFSFMFSALPLADIGGLPPDLAALLLGVALFAGFVDAIAGGGGLLTLPALLLAGLSPVEAIATNKLQGTFGVASSSYSFWRAGRVERDLLPPLFGAAFCGGVADAAFANLIPAQVLRGAIPLVLIGVALFVLLTPRLGDDDAVPRLQIGSFALSFGLGIGAYDGAFGPGAGTFYMLALILICGFGMMRAVAHTRLMNFGSNLGSLLFFLASGDVRIAIGLLMGMGAAIGAALGARVTMRFGARLIRPLVIGISLLLALRLLADPANPVGAMLRRLL